MKEGRLLQKGVAGAGLANLMASASPQSMRAVHRIDCGDAEALKLLRPASTAPIHNNPSS